MKAIALNSLNQPVLNGTMKTREQWQRWGERNVQFLPGEIRASFRVVVAFFDCPDKGQYYRVNTGGQPYETRTRINGNPI